MGSRVVILLIRVDDNIVAASDMELMHDTKQMLQEKFNVKDLARLSYFLGIHFQQGYGFVRMNQRHYLSIVLQRFLK
mgnify:FL=1